jgi:hypothetical protein
MNFLINKKPQKTTAFHADLFGLAKYLHEAFKHRKVAKKPRARRAILCACAARSCACYQDGYTSSKAARSTFKRCTVGIAELFFAKDQKQSGKGERYPSAVLQNT